MENFKWVEVTPENVDRESLFCSRDNSSEGFKCKKRWLAEMHPRGLKLRILKNLDNIPVAYIEYMPVEVAWRPVRGNNYMFIQCMFIQSKNARNKGLASYLIRICEQDAHSQNMDGICTMTSNGPWVFDKRLFEKNGFSEVDKRGRFELMTKKFSPDAPAPSLINWEENQKEYKGLNLVYADQCPWHEKSVLAVTKVASDLGMSLEISKLTSAEQAKNAPSGFGTFSLLKDGKLLEDHYLSETRIRSILTKIK